MVKRLNLLIVLACTLVQIAKAEESPNIQITDWRGKDYPFEKVTGFIKALSGRGNCIIFLYLDSEGLPLAEDKTLQEIKAAAQQLKKEGHRFYEILVFDSQTGKRGLEIFIDGYHPPGYDDPSGGEYGGLTLSVTRYVKEEHAWQEKAKAKAEITD